MKLVAHVSGREILKNPRLIEQFAEAGLGVELQLTAEVLDSLTLKDFGKLRRLAGGAPITVHAPFIDLNPGALDPYVLRATRDRFFETITAAKVLNAEVIVFHTGYHPQKVDPFYDSWFERALETFKEVTEEWNRKVALENVFDRNPKNLKNFVKNLPENAGVCLDVGHMNLFSEVPVSLWFEMLGNRIYEFHLHDNLGIQDSHLPMGLGTVNYPEVFAQMEKLKQEYILNLENKSYEDVLKSLDFLRRNVKWREISLSTPTKS